MGEGSERVRVRVRERERERMESVSLQRKMVKKIVFKKITY